MAFFDKLGDIAKNIGDKTNDAIETSKLNSKISAEKSAINEVMKQIGVYYYEKYSEGGETDEDIREWCAAIDEHNRNISAAQTEIERIRMESEEVKNEAMANAAETVTTVMTEAVICSACGAANENDVKFCQECGNKLKTQEPAKDSVCKNCGAKVPEGIKFCGECGTKME